MSDTFQSVFARSSWIWVGDATAQDQYGEFYDEFCWDGRAPVTCHLSVDGDYTLYINGQFASAEQYADYEHDKVYDTIEMTSHLSKGKNTVFIIVWHMGAECSRFCRYSAGLIYEIRQGVAWLGASGSHTLARQSRCYRSGYCKWVTPQMGYSFLYDATEEIGDAVPGDGFCHAVPVQKECVFRPRPIGKLVIGDKIPSECLCAEDRHFVFDLGRESVGLPLLEFDSDTVQKVTVAWGEDLQGGHVRRVIEYRDFSFEYVAREGHNRYTNYMFPIGARYMEVFTEAPIRVRYIGLLERYYPVKRTGIGMDDALDRAIYRLSVRTLELCMFGHYVDTPWREQCLYAYDARNQMLCGYDAFEGGNREYARSNLALIGQDRREDGLLSICAPSSTPLAIPSFSLYYFVAVDEYVEHTGDVSLAREVYDKLLSVIRVFIRHRHNGAVHRFTRRSHWNFYDWSTYLDASEEDNRREIPDLMINVLFLLALQKLKNISARIGEPFSYDALIEEQTASIRALFWREEDGLFSFTVGNRDDTELGNALAILTHVATEEESRRIAEKLSTGMLSESSLSMKCWKYDALLLVDRQKYRSVILDEIRKNYGRMAASGATSVWETAEGASAFDNAGSLCHGWSAIPVHYYWEFYRESERKL